MKISISPQDVTSEEGSVTCTEAEVSCAISTSAAVRVVPVDSSGNEYPENAGAIVGDETDPDVLAFITAVSEAVATLISAKGL